MAQPLEYENYENSFREQALPHFVKSISSLLAVVRIAANVGSREMEDTDIAKVQGELEIADKEALESAKATEDLVDLIDGTCEKLTADHGQVTKARKEQAATLQSMQSQLRSLESNKELINGRLQEAKTSLRQAESALRAARAMAGEKQTGRDVGIGLSFLLPCVGIPMAVAFEKERQNRKSEVDVASKERSILQADITKDEEQLGQINSQVPELYNKIDGVSENLEESKTAELTLRGSRAGLAEVQGRMRMCCQYLSSVQGRVAALKVQTKNLYNVSLLFPFLEEAIVQAQQVPHSEPLFNHIQVHRVIGDLQTLLPKISQLRSQDNTDYMK
uniref:tropomyosin-like n=1 Tax=Pristiophorus japonicus TaxID=55135 RepID=UPI00398EAF49